MRSIQVVTTLLLLFTSSPILLKHPSSAKPITLPEIHHPMEYRPASLNGPGVPPYVPSDIWRAYDFLPLYSQGVKGNGTRIAIIDAYGDPTLSSDLSTFNSLTGLPSATVNTFYPDGVPRRGNSGWAMETALDVEWAHAIAPSATIDLVVAFDANLGSVYDGIAYVANSLTNETVLSMSLGLSESLYPTTGSFTIAATHQLFVTITSHGTTPFASSGDSGAGSCCDVSYPASDPLVVGVGGTTLNLDSNASYSSESAWSGSGAGASIVFAKPTWQKGLGDSMRDIVDVSYDADLNTGFLIVQGGAEFQVGGTSAGAPQWAALVALASQERSKKYGAISSQLYNASAYHDITTGSDGFFSATPGWDYPTGLGTPDATTLVNSLQPFNFTISSNAETYVSQGGSNSNILSVTLLSGLAQPVALNITGLPTNTTATFTGGCTGIPTCTGSPSFDSVLTITTSKSTPFGIFTVRVTASSGAQIHVTTFLLNVYSPTTGGGGGSRPRRV